MSIYDSRLGKALDIFNNGFRSKADKTRVNGFIGTAYDDIAKGIKNTILSERRNITDDLAFQALTDLYYSIPQLHHWKDKHDELFSAYPDEVKKIKRLVSLRAAAKEAEIIPVERDPDLEKIEEIKSDVMQILAQQKERYVENLEFAKHFNALPVSVNAHWVTNQKGSDFIRYFFYLNGRLTPLSQIIAIAQELEKENK